jgi:hypothetical protein
LQGSNLFLKGLLDRGDGLRVVHVEGDRRAWSMSFLLIGPAAHRTLSGPSHRVRRGARSDGPEDLAAS